MKIALIGHRGHWGYVLRDLARLPEVEVSAISGGGDAVEPMVEALKKYYDKEFALYDDYRKMLDEAGLQDCKITVSNSLDEYLIRDIIMYRSLLRKCKKWSD